MNFEFCWASGLKCRCSEYLDDLESVGPTVEAAIRDARPAGPLGRRHDARKLFNLKELIAATDPRIAAIPPEELISLLGRLKTFAKRVHRASKHDDKAASPQALSRRDNSMPVEVAQVATTSPAPLHRACGTPHHRTAATTDFARMSPGSSTNRGSIRSFARSF